MLFVNGELFSALPANTETTVRLPPGEHILHVKAPGTRDSPELQVKVQLDSVEHLETGEGKYFGNRLPRLLEDWALLVIFGVFLFQPPLYLRRVSV